MRSIIGLTLLLLAITVNSQQLQQYQYWLDNDFINRQTIISSADSISFDINTNLLSTGFHTLNFQSQDKNGLRSSVISNYFLKVNSGNKILNYRYWFDTAFASFKTNAVVLDSSNQLIEKIDIEFLTLGTHTFHYQFSDDNFNWSSVFTDTITRVPITQKIFIEPKVYATKANINSGETQTITGKDFTSNGTVNLYVKNSVGDFIPINNSFTYLSNGGFTYQLQMTSDMQGGEYTVYATDVTTNTTTSTIKFLVSNLTISNLVINKPKVNDQYVLNQTIPIEWGDFISKSSVTGKTGYVQKSYKIELSKDNGITWTMLESSHIINNAIPGIFNPSFSSTCTIAATGSYLIKVTDNDNPLNKSISNSFKVVSAINGGFDYSLEWDNSSPTPSMVHPIGLTADGTSRIFVRLIRSLGNNKSVTKIRATISSINDAYTTPDLLGKITYASTHTTYNEDGNNATSNSYTYTVLQNGNEFWFWLVAPDDFTQIPSDERSERQIKVNFVITYSDNSTETISTSKAPIYVVRPPLFLVHGIDGDATSFEDFKYNIGNGAKFFANNGYGGEYSNPIWKDARRLTLIPYGSFAQNAEVILGTNTGDADYNSFQSSLKLMHSKGYACNRVDYVAHSMGGCVARTIINLYVDSYKPPANSSFQYKNYSRGFINKLITINTPHNGSQVADLVNDDFGNSLTDPIIYLLRTFGEFKGFFVRNGLSYKVSPALLDLQAYTGGITFTKTSVKNHIIGSDLDANNTFSEYNIRNQIGNLSYDFLYNEIMPTSFSSINSFMNSTYKTSEFISNSDFMVPVSSQFAGKSETDPNITDISLNPLGATNASILYGITINHTEVRSNITIGTRVMHLLNSAINSSYFADGIAANPNLNGSHVYKIESQNSFADSIKNYYDTLKIKIVSPKSDSIVYVDSSISIQLNIKDTSNLQQVRLIFQGQLYSSTSKLSAQSFNVKVNPNQIGNDKILGEAIYDSLGFTINHTDTISVNVKASGTLKGFYIFPKTTNLNPQQTFQPVYNVIYSHYSGVLNNDITPMTITIADKNVVTYNKKTYQFSSKDTGTTYIIFKYRTFSDTAYIYISELQESTDKKVNISMVSTNTIKDSEFVTLFPNPASNRISLVSSIKGFAEIRLINSNGKTIRIINQAFLTNRKQTISLTGLSAGIYFAQIKIADKVQNIKFLKE